MNGFYTNMEVWVIKEDQRLKIEIPPLPGSYGPFEGVEVRGRLSSTGGGANYNWCANFELPSRAPFEPFIHLRFLGEAGIQSLGWHMYSSLGGGEAGVSLSWGGTLVDAPAVVWGQQVVDLTKRAEREQIIEIARSCLDGETWTQGGLTVQPVNITKAEAEAAFEHYEDVVRRPYAPVTLFNHAIFAAEVVALDNFRLIYFPVNWRLAPVITSPDHLLEPICLEPGWFYLLSHPFPSRNSRVD